MKRYLGKVIRLFMERNYSRKTVNDFHHWLLKEDNSKEKDEVLKEVWDNMSVHKDKNTDTAFNTFLSKVGMEEVVENRKHIRINLWKYASAAAVISCIISTATTYLLIQNEEDIPMVECYVPKTETREVILPDGSKACLNSGSYILYPEGFKGDIRDIYLVGEAVFDVAKNKEKPFIVHSNDMSVTAIGTKFNVKAYPEDDFLTTTLLQGKVKVNCKDSVDYYLEPGQQLRHNKLTCSNVVKNDIDGNLVTAWQRGEVVLSEVSIKEICLALENRYGIEFHSYGTGKQTNDLFSFTFKKESKIEEVLEILKVVIGNMDYKLKDNVCNIYWN